jgi:hypothetical protein
MTYFQLLANAGGNADATSTGMQTSKTNKKIFFFGKKKKV